MLFFENLLLAFTSLLTNKMRSLLTMLGIIIGIGSVIAIVTVGNSLTNSITSEMSDMGANNVNNAKKYQSEQVPAAEAEADRIIQNAEAEKAARIAEAEGEAAKFNSIFEEYSKYPLITKQRMFYEAMENVLPDAKVIITDGNTQQMLPLESFTTGVTSSTSTGETTSTSASETTEGN